MQNVCVWDNSRPHKPCSCLLEFLVLVKKCLPQVFSTHFSLLLSVFNHGIACRSSCILKIFSHCRKHNYCCIAAGSTLSWCDFEGSFLPVYWSRSRSPEDPYVRECIKKMGRMCVCVREKGFSGFVRQLAKGEHDQWPSGKHHAKSSASDSKKTCALYILYNRYTVSVYDWT